MVKLTNLCRFLSDESAMVTAYGFPDIDFNEYSAVNSKDGSSYFFVPQVKCLIYEMLATSVLTLYMVLILKFQQIELDEHEEVSILAVTLAWDYSLSYSFAQTISSYEKSIFQVC